MPAINMPWSKGKKSAKLGRDPSFRDVQAKDEDDNTLLHICCEENQWWRVQQILADFEKASGGAEKVKKLLLQENKDGLTPIDLAIQAAGDSDTGESQLKLLLSAYVRKLEMLPLMFEKGKTEEAKEKGIWNLPGFKLPALGTLSSRKQCFLPLRVGLKGVSGGRRRKSHRCHHG